MCRATLVESPVQVQSVNVAAHTARLRQEAREILRQAAVVRERVGIVTSGIDEELRAVEALYRGYISVFRNEDV
jgi:hypothetical protein